MPHGNYPSITLRLGDIVFRRKHCFYLNLVLHHSFACLLFAHVKFDPQTSRFEVPTLSATALSYIILYSVIYDPRHEKTEVLPMRKNKRRKSVVQLQCMCSNCTADQYLCFRCTYKAILQFQVSSLLLRLYM